MQIITNLPSNVNQNRYRIAILKQWTMKISKPIINSSYKSIEIQQQT